MKISGPTAIRLSIRICKFMKASTHQILILITLRDSSFSNEPRHDISDNVVPGMCDQQSLRSACAYVILK